MKYICITLCTGFFIKNEIRYYLLEDQSKTKITTEDNRNLLSEALDFAAIYGYDYEDYLEATNKKNCEKSWNDYVKIVMKECSIKIVENPDICSENYYGTY